MKSALKEENIMKNIVKNSWDKIAPTWPLQNIIACNPLQGFENLNFETALKKGFSLFQNPQLPPEMSKVNYLTIKWCQVFFDQGQATIQMPYRDQGFYKSWKKLAIFDEQLHQNYDENINFLHSLPESSAAAISVVLQRLTISDKYHETITTFLLTTLAGWSSYVKYLGEWNYVKNDEIESDYLAIRLIITALIWPKAGTEIPHLAADFSADKQVENKVMQITANEKKYRENLITKIYQSLPYLKLQQNKYDAQMVFCIDVRSEQIRRAIENCGNYQTFGFAGFFGIPTAITNDITQESYASCPVLLSPKHNVSERNSVSENLHAKQIKGYSTISEIKKFYQSLKYNFTTPLPLAEGMGIWSGGWMFIKTFSPKSRKILQNQLQKTFNQKLETSPEINSIPFEDQCNYAVSFFKAIGLTENFANIVLLCGHGSQTENNTYATALDCGACGGRHGDSNAKILAKILNQPKLREHLKNHKIVIPETTQFVAAKHNTTTDDIEIYQSTYLNLETLISDLKDAKTLNNAARAHNMGFADDKNKLNDFFFLRSHNWSETQPEWGLAKNASFIVGPRSLTQNINLQGRSFLHSYDWEVDEDCSILNLILNAPMVVAQWINSQYLFSTLDNVAFGSGSKITQNIVGKIGVMQGNASDLMHGLPLQSVFANDQENYHEALRLTTLIYAPSSKIDKVMQDSAKLQQLVFNQWITIYCVEPINNKVYQLNTDLTWREVENTKK